MSSTRHEFTYVKLPICVQLFFGDAATQNFPFHVDVGPLSRFSISRSDMFGGRIGPRETAHRETPRSGRGHLSGKQSKCHAGLGDDAARIPAGLGGSTDRELHDGRVRRWNAQYPGECLSTENTPEHLSTDGPVCLRTIEQFSSDCSGGPASQRMRTVYPDKYTVLSRCDLGWNYIIDPSSRGGGCVVWPLKSDTCSSCACPFCLRDTGGVWGSTGSGNVTWLDMHPAISPVTGAPVTVWRALQANGNIVEHAVSAAGLPVTQSVSSPSYLTVATHFDSFTLSVPLGTFDVPAICANATRRLHAANASHDAARSRAALRVGPAADVSVAADQARPPPPLGVRFRASVTTNIAQPGYEGGNVLTVVHADCSRGPRKQRMHTTYGNFHTVSLHAHHLCTPLACTPPMATSALRVSRSHLLAAT